MIYNSQFLLDEIFSYTEEDIDNFICRKDIQKLLTEISNVNTGDVGDVDDGPIFLYGDKNYYHADTLIQAEKLGFAVVDYLIGSEKIEKLDTAYPKGPVGSVSFFPAGEAGKTTAFNMSDLKGKPAYIKWLKHIKKISKIIGWEFLKDIDSDWIIKSTHQEPNTHGERENLKGTPNVSKKTDKIPIKKI